MSLEYVRDRKPRTGTNVRNKGWNLKDPNILSGLLYLYRSYHQSNFENLTALTGVLPDDGIISPMETSLGTSST